MSTTYSKLRDIARKTRGNLSDGMTRAEMEVAIVRISAELSGPGVEPGMRIALNEDRHALRAALKATQP